jgi:hypothetical protein
MQLRGIATALYGTQSKSTVSVTTLTSESADKIFIERTQKIDIDPFNSAEAREAFLVVLNEMCLQPPQTTVVNDQIVHIPTAVIYGVPDQHPEVVYSSLIRGAFPEYFDCKPRAGHVAELMEKLLLSYHSVFGISGSAIETKPHALYVNRANHTVKAEFLEPVSRELDRLHSMAFMGNREAIHALEEYTRADARSYAVELFKRGILPPRFVQYGLRDGNVRSASTYLEWFNLRDIFAEELMGLASANYNICIKTPNDPPSPPFADICATQLADYWDILEGRHRKRNVYARFRD